jgi:hypothetical protein
MAVKSVAELGSSLRLVNETQLKILLRSEDIRGPWDSYKSDTAVLPLQSTPSKRATIRYAINSVNGVVDLRGESIDKSTWTIHHHCARLLLLWDSEALTGPGGKLEGFKMLSLQKKDYYSRLFDVYAKLNDDHVIPNLLSPEPGVKILWQWLTAPGEPENEASRGVTDLTFNEAKRTVDAIFNFGSSGHEFVNLYHVGSQSEVYDEAEWVKLVHQLSRDIRGSGNIRGETKIRQITIEVHTTEQGSDTSVAMRMLDELKRADDRQDVNI